MLYCVGLGRTGTRTLSVALGELGFKAAHWSPMYAAMNDDLSVAPHIFEDYDAILDGSVPLIYQDHWKEGDKAILTEREPITWLRSVEALYRRSPVIHEKDRALRLRTYNSDVYDEEKMLEGYRRNKENVEKFFEGQKENLLHLNIVAGDGWEKLCPFLDRSVPNKKLPHENKFCYK